MNYFTYAELGQEFYCSTINPLSCFLSYVADKQNNTSYEDKQQKACQRQEGDG